MKGGGATAYKKKTNNPRMGRPKKNRTVGLNLKSSPRENEILKECAELTGMTKTDVVVEGISLVYEKNRRKE